MNTKFYNKLKNAEDEKEVERAYKNEVEKYFKNSVIGNPYSCDGYLEEEIYYDLGSKVLRLIMEFKKDKDFRKAISRAKVLVQVLFYLKKFRENNGEHSGVPNIILAGDKRTCFVIRGEIIYKYLDRNIDWSVAPSDAPDIFRDLVEEIKNDEEIDPYIFVIDNKFNFKEVEKEIRKLLFEIKKIYNISNINIIKLYETFITDIVIESKNYNSLTLVETFINLIIDNKDVYLHPKLKNVLHIQNDKKINIDGKKFKTFEGNYSNKYSITEQKKILEFKDRLINDTERRNAGEFYTPTTWAEKANEEIERSLGKNYREEFIVWDCAWGTGNLTRDYFFKELYCSTLREEDLELGEINNPEAEKFCFDFLEDGISEDNCLIEETIPNGLRKGLEENRKILIYINPPYGEASNSKAKNRNVKKSIINTKIAEMMKNEKIGFQNQMYGQFIYRILKIKEKYELDNLYFAIFCPPLFFTGSKPEKLREKFKSEFEYLNGFLFKASSFANVSEEWGISFTVWKTGKTIGDINLSILENSMKNGIESLGEKKLYSLRKKDRLSEWVKNENSGEKVNSIYLKSALSYENKICKVSKDALGYLINDSNNIYANAQGVYLLNSKITRHIKTTEITKENIDKIVSIYAARAVIESTWINRCDEYKIPSEAILKDQEWIGQAYIYSIFSNKAQQSSLRNIKVEGNDFNIFNEFFFMSRERIQELADKFNNAELYNDCKRYKKERYIYERLQKIKLPKNTNEVLELAVEMTEETIEYRKEFNLMNPSIYINSWDASWYQIKQLLKYRNEEKIIVFNEKMKILKEDLRKLIMKYNYLEE